MHEFVVGTKIREPKHSQWRSPIVSKTAKDNFAGMPSLSPSTNFTRVDRRVLQTLMNRAHRRSNVCPSITAPIYDLETVVVIESKVAPSKPSSSQFPPPEPRSLSIDRRQSSGVFPLVWYKTLQRTSSAQVSGCS